MSSVQEKLQVIPGIAWVLAAVFLLCTEVLLWQAGFKNDPNVKDWPFAADVLLAALVGGVVVAYVLLVGYISGDSKRRGMRQALWTCIAIFVPNFIGIVLYFVMREPLLACCPKCGTPNKSTFAYCYQCGTEVHPACPSCRRPVEAGWNACAYCGAGLTRRPEVIASGNPASNPNPVG